MNTICQAYAVQSLFVAAQDFWPAMLYCVGQNKIPVLTVASHWQNFNFLKKIWFRLSLYQINIWNLEWEEEKEQFKQVLVDWSYAQKISFNPNRVAATGNPRAQFIQKNFLNQAEKKFSKVLVLASVEPEEDDFLLELVLKLVRAHSTWKIFWVDHKPSLERFQYLHQNLERQLGVKIDWALIESKNEAFERLPLKLYYLLPLGVLGRLYALADIAYVGGGKKKRVHNVWEALAGGAWAWIYDYAPLSTELKVLKEASLLRTLRYSAEAFELLSQEEALPPAEVIQEKTAELLNILAQAPEKIYQQWKTISYES